MTVMGHTPASFLAKEYAYCIGTYDNARKSICLLAIDLYHAEVHPEYREITFKFPEQEKDPDEALRANVKKVDGYFQNHRTCHLPFSFSHFVARAIDQLYGGDVVEQIALIMFGHQCYPESPLEAVSHQAARVLKESHEVIEQCLKLPGSCLTGMSEHEKLELRKELVDVERVVQKFVGQIDSTITPAGPTQ